MNAAERKARAEGYEYTGMTVREWQKEEILEDFKACKAEVKKYGSKAKLILCTDVSSFRGEKRHSSYWSIFIKYSDAHKEAIRKQRETDRANLRKRVLIDIVNDNKLTVQELTQMLEYKTAQLISETVKAVKEGSL